MRTLTLFAIAVVCCCFTRVFSTNADDFNEFRDVRFDKLDKVSSDSKSKKECAGLFWIGDWCMPYWMIPVVCVPVLALIIIIVACCCCCRTTNKRQKAAMKRRRQRMHKARTTTVEIISGEQHHQAEHRQEVATAELPVEQHFPGASQMHYDYADDHHDHQPPATSYPPYPSGGSILADQQPTQMAPPADGVHPQTFPPSTESYSEIREPPPPGWKTDALQPKPQPSILMNPLSSSESEGNGDVDKQKDRSAIESSTTFNTMKPLLIDDGSRRFEHKSFHSLRERLAKGRDDASTRSLAGSHPSEPSPLPGSQRSRRSQRSQRSQRSKLPKVAEVSTRDE